MNEWDRNNLHFILDSDEATLEDFYSWATEDDLAYALSLVREAKTELLVQEAEILDELLTDATADDVSEANSSVKAISTMSHQFLIMWCNEGLECCIDITEDEQRRMWRKLKGEPMTLSAIPNYNHLLLRARYNSQRHYEIYSVEATDGITAEDIQGHV
jgi:hypothetical protein